VLVCFAGTALVLVLVTKAALRVPELDIPVSEVVVVVVVVTSRPESSPVIAGLPASLVIVIVVVSTEAVLKPVVVVVVVVVGRGPKTGFVAATAGHVPTLATLIVASGM
jgi:hypothetical protein